MSLFKKVNWISIKINYPYYGNKLKFAVLRYNYYFYINYKNRLFKALLKKQTNLIQRIKKCITCNTNKKHENVPRSGIQ